MSCENYKITVASNCSISVQNTCTGSIQFFDELNGHDQSRLYFDNTSIEFSKVVSPVGSPDEIVSNIQNAVAACSQNGNSATDEEEIRVSVDMFSMTSTGYRACVKGAEGFLEILRRYSDSTEFLNYVFHPDESTTVENLPNLEDVTKCEEPTRLKQGKVFVNEFFADIIGAPKGTPSRRFWLWQDQTTCQVCVTAAGDDPNIFPESIIVNYSELINIDNMASDNLGALPSISSEIKTKKGRAIDICGTAAGRTVTLADLATITDADIATLTAAIVPDAGYEWALLGIQVNQHPAKKQLFCDLAAAQMTVTSNEQVTYAFDGDAGQFITVGDSPDEIIKILPDADACGCLGDRTALITDADFTTPLTLAANTAIELCPIYVCVAADTGVSK